MVKKYMSQNLRLSIKSVFNDLIRSYNVSSPMKFLNRVALF